MRWVKIIRDEEDVKKECDLCPICKQDTLELAYHEKYDEIVQERCSKGCYTYDFRKQKRIK